MNLIGLEYGDLGVGDSLGVFQGLPDPVQLEDAVPIAKKLVGCCLAQGLCGFEIVGDIVEAGVLVGRCQRHFGLGLGRIDGSGASPPAAVRSNAE